MLAERYAALSGMTLLGDPTRIDLYGVPTLLMHGDTLCTDDTAYQAFRRRVRHPLSLAVLRRLPLALRHRLARQARTGSESAKAGKPAGIMDVNTDAVVPRAARTAGKPSDPRSHPSSGPARPSGGRAQL